MKLQQTVLIATTMLALAFSATAIAGKGAGGGGAGGMGGMTTNAPKSMPKQQTRVRVESGEQKGSTVRERTEGYPEGGGKGSGGGKQGLEVNPLNR